MAMRGQRESPGPSNRSILRRTRTHKIHTPDVLLFSRREIAGESNADSPMINNLPRDNSKGKMQEQLEIPQQEHA
jgi:hypothetical protein